MAERAKHRFQFGAHQIATAAAVEADYHAERIAFWRQELETATKRVEETASVKVVRQQITGGWRPEVVVDYGDLTAYRRMQEAGMKISQHEDARTRFLADAQLYGTQGERVYELDADDVVHYRFNGRARDE